MRDAIQTLEHLKSLPKDQALTLLERLREDDNVVATSSSFDSNEVRKVHHRTPEHEAMNSQAGSIRRDLESELKRNNPQAYPALRPITASLLAESNLLKPFQSTPSAGEKALPRFEQTQMGTSNVDRAEASPIDADSAVQHFRSAVNQSTSESDYHDTRLHDLTISFWTDVDITDSFAARVISLYLKTDHPLLGLFDPDLFITDLISQRSQFCSRFLVHALLCLGSQMYCAFDKTANALAHTFRQEAETLWANEKQHESYQTMAGSVMLSLSLMGHGRDHAVLNYTNEAVQMGTRLGLFGAREDNSVQLNTLETEELHRARRYAAWGVFNWAMLVSLFYRQPGSVRITDLPIVLAPGEDIFVYQEEDVSKKGVSPDEILMGRTFPALCNFWQILHGAMWIYYSDENCLSNILSLSHAEHIFRELIAFIEALPDAMQRNKDTPHHVVVFHCSIWFHSAILDIFRPFGRRQPHQRLRLKTFSALDSFPDAIYSASVNQLKRLIIDYRTNYETSVYSILWHTGLLYLANAMLQDTEDPQWRLYFQLCIYGYESLSRPYRISEAIVRGLLSMTLRDTDMTGNDARTLMQQVERSDANGDTAEVEKIRATFMVDLILALTDPQRASVETLADEFENMALFQEFLDRDRMES